MKKIILLGTVIIFFFTFSIHEMKEEKTIHQKILDSISDSLIGRIEIPSLSINLEIVEGTEKEVLDQNYVGHVSNSSLNFEEEIILAGHNNKQVFAYLYQLRKGDVVNLAIYKRTKKYCVTNNLEIEQTDYTYFKKNSKTLVLITCTNEETKRRIILLKQCD